MITAFIIALLSLITAGFTWLAKVYKIPPPDTMPSLDNSQLEVNIVPEAPKLPQEPRKDYIGTLALGIRDFEGYIPPGGKDGSGTVHPNGSMAWRCRNPGNIKATNGEELVFKTYDDGFDYLLDYLNRACTGKHKAYKPEMTLMQFTHVFTGDPEPSPTNYANFLSTRLGLPTTTKLKELV